MKLSDVMSAARLEVFAEIGLVLFALAFLTVLVTTLLRRNQPSFERASRLPLDEAERWEG
jgi:cbb3-type cytochrome oxidase subunit 3